MQFKFAALLPIVALASGASAAECYAQGGSQTCVANDLLWSFREDYCTNNWQGNGNSTYNAGAGFSARFTQVGAFDSQQECWDSTENIIRQCYGQKNGGTWTVATVRVDINFCT